MARQPNPINHPYYLELLKSMIQFKKKGNIQQPLTGYDLEALVDDGELEVSKEYVKKIFRRKNPRYSIGSTILDALTKYVGAYETYQDYEDFETKEYWSGAINLPRKSFVNLSTTQQKRINKKITVRINAILAEQQKLKNQFAPLNHLGVHSQRGLENTIIERLYKQQKQKKDHDRFLEKEKNYDYKIMKLQTSVNAIEELLQEFSKDVTPQNALTKNALILGKLNQVKELMNTAVNQEKKSFKASTTSDFSHYLQKQYQSGLLAQIEFNFNQANTFFKKVLRANPKDLKCLFFLARNYYFLGSLSKSILHFEKALEIANEEKNEIVIGKINSFLNEL